MVPAMDDAQSPDPSVSGPLTRDAALAHLERGGSLLESGDFHLAAVHFSRVVGFDDPEITAAGLLGLGEARYRQDDEDGAVASWAAVTQLPDTPSTYLAWRNLAAARVRADDLNGAMNAYREADRRAPAADKAEIANRLGWLSKETGDARASRRYFAKGRGDGPLIPMATVILAATVIVSMTVFLSSEGDALVQFLWLDKAAVAAGEYWRLWTVTLVHGDLLHLFFNMYALFLAGPVVERWYGSILFVVFYLLCAAAGSVASFLFGGSEFAVGASGAIFGLFGILLAAGRAHRPDRSGEPWPHPAARRADRDQPRVRVRLGRHHRQRRPHRRARGGPVARLLHRPDEGRHDVGRVDRARAWRRFGRGQGWADRWIRRRRAPAGSCCRSCWRSWSSSSWRASRSARPRGPTIPAVRPRPSSELEAGPRLSRQ